MSQKHPSRRSWIPRVQTDANTDLNRTMSLKKWKLFKVALVSVMIATIATLGVFEGGDPTVIIPVAIIAMGALNGVELSEWVAAREQIRQAEQKDNSE